MTWDNTKGWVWNSTPRSQQCYPISQLHGRTGHGLSRKRGPHSVCIVPWLACIKPLNRIWSHISRPKGAFGYETSTLHWDSYLTSVSFFKELCPRNAQLLGLFSVSNPSQPATFRWKQSKDTDSLRTQVSLICLPATCQFVTSKEAWPVHPLSI